MAGLVATPTAANDSAASLGAGGLVLERAAAIAMTMEALEIGRSSVRVRYRFVNRGPAEISTLVAFPLPDVGPEYREDGDFHARADPANFVGFTVSVDGRRVTPRAELRAFVGTRDVTGLLREARVPVSLFDANLDRTLQALPPAARARLEAARAVDDGSSPLWRMRARLYWTQRFPPGRAVAVEHRYQPIAGGSFIHAGDLREPTRRSPYCLDEASRVRLATVEADVPVYVVHVDYILTTARNWAGPIGDFTLVVDSGDREYMATACLDGVRRVSAQRVEARLADFTPARELIVGFIALPSLSPPGDAPGAFPQGSERSLTAQDLAGLSLAQLRIMRNEIYARHGFIFRSEPLRRHFTAQPWYQARSEDVTAMMTAVERANVALILERERALAR